MRQRAWTALAALVGVALTYTGVGPLGLLWDDYIVLRPRTGDDLMRVWLGSWDPSHAFPTFYRPLAVWADAAAFQWLGFNETALHAAALLQLAIGAWLVGEFIRREVSSPPLGAFAAALYAVHPAVSASAGVWWFEQNHRLALICVVAAMLCWQRRRSASAWLAWWPAHLWILAGSLFKEDVAILSPLLVILQWWRARTCADCPAPTRALVLSTGAACSAWFGIRWWLLGTIGGRPVGGPDGTFIDACRHLVRGLWLTLLKVQPPMPAPPHLAHTIATLALVSAWLAALWISRRSSSRSRLLGGYGLVMAVAFNAPFILASHPTRYHLVALGAVIALTGLCAAYADVPRGHTAGVAVAAAVLVVTLSLAARANVTTYGACTAVNVRLDREWAAWLQTLDGWQHSWILSWLDEKAQRCADGRTVVLTDAIPDVLADVRSGRRR